MKRLLSAMLFVACTCAAFAQNTPASLSAEAWKAWQSNNTALAETKFLEALSAQQDYTPAEAGLYYLYLFQRETTEANKRLANIMRNEKNAEPYAFAAIHTPYGLAASGDDAGWDILEEITKRESSNGILKAIANEYLGLSSIQHAELSDATKYFAKMNAMTDWKVIGPFDNISASGIDKVFPPETEFKPDAKYNGSGNVPVHWFNPVAMRRDMWVDFDRYFDIRNGVFYANMFVYSPQKQKVQLRIGTSGAIRAFLNDELFLEDTEEKNNDLDTYITEAELQLGWNRVLLKLGCAEIERCNFLFRATDAAGNPVEGLKTSTEPQQYASKPGAAFKNVEHFAEKFFKEKISAQPDEPVNYLLLADVYHHNDKALESELILRDALKRFPDANFIHKPLLETYLRAEKFDEYNTLLEKMYTVDNNNIDALEVKISRALENEEYDAAAGFIEQYERLRPGSETSYANRIKVAASKNQAENLISLVEDAYKAYPDYWDFVYMKSLIEMQKSQSFSKPLSIINSYVENNYTAAGLIKLADVYAEAKQMDKYEATYEKIFELDPTLCGYYNTFARKMLEMQNYPKAEKAAQRAIELCPVNSHFYFTLGDIYREASKIPAARIAYEKSLLYNARNFSAREVLRDIDNKKSIFSNFTTANIDSIIASSPSAEDYPGKPAVILHESMSRVVYPGGASESMAEMMIKCLNSTGVDYFKEYNIGVNGYSNEYIIEKAVSIKADKREIKADVSGSLAVFKTLEPGDMIYVKYRVREYNFGKLSDDFWDSFSLNGFLPIRHISYSLLVPDTMKFDQYLQGTNLAPLKKQTEDGTIYSWKMTDEADMEYEEGMPPMADAGKYLQLSSIGDWQELVDWYADLTHSKTKATYEIKEQVQELLKDKQNLSDEQKVMLVYNFITENIRYSSIPFRQSGIIPQTARDVLVNKIGDCKDVATLAISMLQEMGITAHYVLLNTVDEGTNQNSLPSPNLFNHCIAAVETKKGLQYIDLTAKNYPYGSVPYGDIGAFMLLIKKGVNKPGYLARTYFTPQNMIRKTVANVSADNSLTMKVSTVRTGGSTAYIRDKYRDTDQKEQEKKMLASISSDYANAKLTALSFGKLDGLEPQLEYKYDYQIPYFVMETGQFRLMKMPWADPFVNITALSHESRNFPLITPIYTDTLMENLEIILPAGYKPMDLVPKVQYSGPGMEYEVTYTQAPGKLTARRRLIQRKDKIYPLEYAEYREFYNRVLKEDTRQILLTKGK